MAKKQKTESESEEIKNNEETVNTETEQTKTKPQKEETVTISKSDFDNIMGRLDKNHETIDLLLKVADKAALSKVMNQSGESLVRTYSVSTLDGKIIVGWKMTKNIAELINGRLIEDQQVAIMFEDGTSQEITLLDFYRKIHKIKGEMTGKETKTDSFGKEFSIIHISFDDGKKLSIDSRFVN